MNVNNQGHENCSIIIPLTQEALDIANKFAREQPTKEKSQRVYFNTLAVCAVNNYLKILGFSTNLKASDSWNGAVRLAFDIADLWVVGKGRLECRPIKPDAIICHIPKEVEFDRIGYVVVQIDSKDCQATLLGFSPTTVDGELSLGELRSPKDFPAYLNQLRLQANLSQWFTNTFEAGWQTVETILGNSQTDLALAFRSKFGNSSVTRCKLIEFELGFQELSVVLIVALTPETESTIDINVELRAISSQICLPPNIQLMLLDEDGQTITNAQAGNSNRHIQLELSGEPGDRFSLLVALDKTSIIEDFVV